MNAAGHHLQAARGNNLTMREQPQACVAPAGPARSKGERGFGAPGGRGNPTISEKGNQCEGGSTFACPCFEVDLFNQVFHNRPYPGMLN